MVLFIMAFSTSFLVPSQVTMDRSLRVYLTLLAIVQNPHAHSANQENDYLLVCAGYRPLLQLRNFGSPNALQALHRAQWHVQGMFNNT
jgi:hypothetical protein